MNVLNRSSVIVFMLLLMSAITLTAACAVMTQASSSWKIVIPPKDEPGEKLVVRGIVLDQDGKTPIAGARVYVYHTDQRGFYGPGNNGPVNNPRLNGTITSNARGEYEFQTIKPGTYPEGGIPAHIHFVVDAKGYKQRVFEIVFEGDRFIDERLRERAKAEWSIFSIRPLTKDSNGVLQCTQEIRLERAP
jgi:protocatechuate 3,4-dioxygenase beta subunit